MKTWVGSEAEDAQYNHRRCGCTRTVVLGRGQNMQGIGTNGRRDEEAKVGLC